jgi:hypothetical protein
MLWVHLVKVASQLLVVLAQLLLGYDLVDLFVLALVWVSLSAQHEGHLLLGGRVVASFHDFTDHLRVVHLLGYPESIAVLPLTLVDIECSLVRLAHLLSVGSVLTASAEVPTDSIIIMLIAECAKLAQALCLHHQVDSLRLLVMVNEVWDYQVD